MTADIGRWYAEKEAEARRLAALYEERKAEGATAKELERIARELEQARFVGD
jgi:hypothetical protein